MKLPSAQAAGTLHGFLDFQLAILDIGKGDLRILVGQNLEFLNSFIHHPVFILKPAQLVAGFLGVIGARAEIVACLALRVGNDRSNLLGTVCI